MRQPSGAVRQFVLIQCSMARPNGATGVTEGVIFIIFWL